MLPGTGQPHETPCSTSLATESAVQRAWRPRPGCAEDPAYDALVRNEFLAPAEGAALQWQALRRVIAFCAHQVPYYRRLFAQLGLSPADFRGPADLRRLPMLTKADLQERGRELWPTSLPPGVQVAGLTATSGSTGQPVKVRHTTASFLLFSLLKQREYRWFRWEPGAVQAAVRPPQDLPGGAGGRPIELGETVRLDRWHRVDTRVQTGPFYGFLRTNPIEAQMQWLREIRPSYLVAQPADLEHLALALQSGHPPDSLRGLLGVAQEVTDEMRGIIERSFSVPLHQNYGLNEIGLVACRCPEAGRFHVHAEHCYLEIVDASGAPCRPGEQGRVLVTALNNAAMPLVRYDTDDLAEASDGPCPCGRALPSFGRILGRYRRTTALPPGSRERFSAIQQALRDMPPDVSGNLRQYQLHQYREGGWELRVVTAAPLPAAFGERLQQRWARVQAGPPVPLRVAEVEQIPRPPGGKFQDFTSDYMPQPGAANTTGSGP